MTKSPRTTRTRKNIRSRGKTRKSSPSPRKKKVRSHSSTALPQSSAANLAFHL